VPDMNVPQILKMMRPYDQTLIKEIDMESTAAVTATLDRAYQLFRNRPRWLEPWQRVAILEQTAALMRGQVESPTQIALEE